MHIGEIVITVLGGVKHRGFQKRDGTQSTMRFQEAEVMLEGARHPREIEVRPPKDGEYPPGKYRIAARSVKVNQYGSLIVEYIDLVPAAAVAAAADRKVG